MSTQQMPRQEKTWYLSLTVIALSALMCRYLAWDFMMQSWAEGGVPISDARALDMWALNILDGLGYRDVMGYWMYEAFRMPFFSVFLAALYAVFGYSFFVVRVVLLGLAIATCLGVAGIGRLLFNRHVGAFGGLLCAFYAPLVEYTTAFMTETLFTFLFVLGVYLFLRGVQERGWGFILGSGIAYGLAGMTRFVIFVTVPVMALCLLTHSGSWRHRIRLLLLWGGVMSVSFSPWLIRNAYVFHTFFPSESGGTRQLWTAANPKYEGFHFTVEAWREILWREPDISEIDRNKRLQRETRQFIRENFVWYLSKIAMRSKYYLTVPDLSNLTDQETLTHKWLTVSTWLASTFGYIGFVLAILKRRRAGLCLAGLFFFLLFLHSLAGELTRYRLTSEWLWLLGAAYTIYCITRISTHSILALDEEAGFPIRRSLFEKRLFQWLIALLLFLPFVALIVKIPLNRNRLRDQKLPKIPASAEMLIKKSGLAQQFEGQGKNLYDTEFYRQIARQHYTIGKRYDETVAFPKHVVLQMGEFSHFVIDNEHRIQSFSFRINKAGLYVGDAVFYYSVKPDIALVLSENIKRSMGLLIGTIDGSGTRGEPRILVSDIYLYNNNIWERCR